MKKKAIADVRNLSPYLKEEIDTVLDFVYNGKRTSKELAYFSLVQEPRKVTAEGEETEVLVRYYDSNLMSHPLIYESDTRVVIIIPYLGAGTTYQAQIKAFNRFGGYLTEWLVKYDGSNVDGQLENKLTQYKRELRNGHDSSTSWFYDGQHLAIDKYPLMLSKLRQQLIEIDIRFADTYYALKGENRRFGLKAGKVFYYKGNNKVEMKIGKGIKKLSKLINIEVNDNQLKDMVSRITSLNAPYRLDILSGAELVQAFHHTQTEVDSKIGTLATSCMRHDRCVDYFGIYKDNAKLLVLRHPATMKIKARALLWETTDGSKIMDRIYGADNKYHLFFDWARDNGYTRKKWQSSTQRSDWVHPDGRVEARHYTIDLYNDECYYSQYPYMDSFIYLNTESKTLSTNSGEYSGRHMLRSTNGGIS